MINKPALIVLAVLLILPPSGFGQTAPEYAIKASFIARFTEFIEWPQEPNDSDASETCVISVIGNAPFRDIFERTFAALKIKNKDVEIRYVSSVEESEGSEILFVSRSEENRLEQIISFTRNRPILTISDMEGFAEQGVIINFYLERQKIRFEINPSALEDAGLQVSSLLLDYATIIDPENAGQ